MTIPSLYLRFSPEGAEVAHTLRRLLEANTKVTVWDSHPHTVHQTSLESLLLNLDRFDFAVFVLSGNDLTVKYELQTLEARDNLMFELGLLTGRLGRSRTFLVREIEWGTSSAFSQPRLPTDIAGLTVVPYSQARAEKNLAAELSPASAIISAAVEELEPLTDLSTEPAQYYSCFISYSHTDYPFAQRLHKDLQELGIRSWLDSEDLAVGSNWQEGLRQAISTHDKVLVVLSESSLNSPWVGHEVERAFNIERESGQTILFPIRLDNAVLKAPNTWSRLLTQRRHISDFRSWQDRKSYQRAFSRLVKRLTVTAAAESDKVS